MSLLFVYLTYNFQIIMGIFFFLIAINKNFKYTGSKGKMWITSTLQSVVSYNEKILTLYMYIY